MVGYLIDLACLVGLGVAVWRGYHQGLFRVGFGILGLVLATAAAALTYIKLGSTLLTHLHLPPIFTALVPFSLVWLGVEAIYLILAYTYWFHQPPPYHNPLTRAIAAVLSGANYVAILALALMLVIGLPLSSSIKDLITQSSISQQLLASTNRYQSSLDQVIDRNLASTLNFFTVAQPAEDETTTELGYHVTNGRVRTDLEDQMLVLVNDERTTRGLQALRPNLAAQAVAIAHSQDMFARGYFSHITPEGLDPFQRMQSSGISFTTAGENLALAPTLPLAHQGLMNSPGHRANILSPNYTTVGIGIVDGGRYGLMITQDFTN